MTDLAKDRGRLSRRALLGTGAAALVVGARRVHAQDRQVALQLS